MRRIFLRLKLKEVKLALVAISPADPGEGFVNVVRLTAKLRYPAAFDAAV
jgi:hypothetical protein